MKKTKHFNISVPELGDVPDITQVSNAISDLEDATAGTLEIMKAEMQGTKITLTSVSRKTKRTGYYEGMSIRFKSPQDIEPNYLKTISVDDLGDQTLSVEYKVNRNEYIDIVYEGNKFTAYPVVVQKTDSVSNNSSVLVGTAKGVKTAYDKGVEALNKANQAQSSANQAQATADGKVSKSGDTMTGALTVNGSSSGGSIIKIEGGKYGNGEIFCGGAQGKSINFYNSSNGHRVSLRDDGGTHIDANNLSTQSKEVISAVNELNSKKSDLTGATFTGLVAVKKDTNGEAMVALKSAYGNGDIYSGGSAKGVGFKNRTSGKGLFLGDDGSVKLEASNLKTQTKDIVNSINTAFNSYGIVDGIDWEDHDYFEKIIKSSQRGSFYTGSKQINGLPVNSPAYRNLLFSGTGDVWQAILGLRPFGNVSDDIFYATATTAADINNINWVKIWHSGVFDPSTKLDKSYCPYNIGDIYITTNSGNPSTTWLGTSWEKIEGRFLLGTSGGASAGTTGGSMSKTISVKNLPSHNHSVSQSEHSHYMFANTGGGQVIQNSGVKEKAPSYKAVLRATTDRDDYLIAGNGGSAVYGRTSDAGGVVSVGYTGSGSALDITPSYYTVHIWKRRG